MIRRIRIGKVQLTADLMYLNSVGCIIKFDVEFDRLRSIFHEIKRKKR